MNCVRVCKGGPDCTYFYRFNRVMYVITVTSSFISVELHPVPDSVEIEVVVLGLPYSQGVPYGYTCFSLTPRWCRTVVLGGFGPGSGPFPTTTSTDSKSKTVDYLSRL